MSRGCSPPKKRARAPVQAREERVQVAERQPLDVLLAADEVGRAAAVGVVRRQRRQRRRWRWGAALELIQAVLRRRGQRYRCLFQDFALCAHARTPMQQHAHNARAHKRPRFLQSPKATLRIAHGNGYTNCVESPRQWLISARRQLHMGFVLPLPG